MSRYILLLLLISSIAAFAKPYKGAEFRTKADLLYGRFEVRMKAASGSGLLSSFFTYNESTNLPADWNEIDIEILGQYSDRVQYNVITQGETHHTGDILTEYNPSEAFHVYAIEWTPDYVAWFIDGEEQFRDLGGHVGQVFHSQRLMFNIWPPNFPGWVGPFNPAVLPVYAYYDWVRYYSYTPGVGDNFTFQWQDDFISFSSARWAKGTHTWPSNNSDFVVQNAVVKDGYAILCLTTEHALGYNGGPIVDVDVDAPYVFWARAYGDHIIVRFSEPLEQASAEDINNYILPSITVSQASLQSDQRTVKLHVSSLDPATSYNLIVRDIGDLAAPQNVMSLSANLTVQPLQFPIQIDVAGDNTPGYYDSQRWAASREYGYTRGSVTNHSQTLDFQNTDEDEVYRSEMRDILFYDVRLPEGSYNITFMMAETQFSSPSSRLFDVYAEGNLIMDDVNVYVAAGLQQNTAVETTIENVVVTDGILNLYFDGLIGDPILSGLKIDRAPTGIGDVSTNLPETFEWTIYPNPFNPSATVRYQLEKASTVEIVFYNTLGQRVREMPRRQQAAGAYDIQFNADNLAAGIYFVEIRVNDAFRQVKKAIYMK